jgi:flagellar hook assembly protein FlgD
MAKRLWLSLCFLIFLYSLSIAAKAYPNPWIPDGKNKSQGTLSSGIVFYDLPASGGYIYIYDSSGALVRKLFWENGHNTVNWDGKNDNGQYVASGVYLWKIKDDGKKVSKLVIIR